MRLVHLLSEFKQFVLVFRVCDILLYHLSYFMYICQSTPTLDERPEESTDLAHDGDDDIMV